MFKKLRKHWLGSQHLKREFGASLNARELMREKKVDFCEDLQLKHCPNREISTSEIRLCRFGGGPKLALLKSPVSVVGDPHTQNASVPHR